MMIYHGPSRSFKCSQCGAIDRIIFRLTPYGQQYRECADCGHDDKPPETTPASYSVMPDQRHIPQEF